LSAGNKVEARHGGGLIFFAARVAFVNRVDGTYALRYDDGDYEHGVLRMRIKVAGEKEREYLQVGDVCDVQYGGGERMSPAKVAQVISPGVYSICYDDGDFECKVGRELIWAQHYPRRSIPGTVATQHGVRTFGRLLPYKVADDNRLLALAHVAELLTVVLGLVSRMLASKSGGGGATVIEAIFSIIVGGTIVRMAILIRREEIKEEAKKDEVIDSEVPNEYRNDRKKTEGCDPVVSAQSAEEAENENETNETTEQQQLTPTKPLRRILMSKIRREGRARDHTGNSTKAATSEGSDDSGNEANYIAKRELEELGITIAGDENCKVLV
jgi:hypothetical protein